MGRFPSGMPAKGDWWGKGGISSTLPRLQGKKSKGDKPFNMIGAQKGQFEAYPPRLNPTPSREESQTAGTLPFPEGD